MHVTVDAKRRIVLPTNIHPGDVLAITEEEEGVLVLARLEPRKRTKKKSLAAYFRKFRSVRIEPDNSPVEPSRW